MDEFPNKLKDKYAQIDREVLIALCNSTNCDGWNGVTVSAGHVSMINLENNHLSGGIPPILGSLCTLQYLYLRNNELTGGIPTEFGNLSNLRCLRIQYHQLSGEIPTSLVNLLIIPDSGVNPNSKFDISYNCLHAGDPTLRVWLSSKQTDWEDRSCMGRNVNNGKNLVWYMNGVTLIDGVFKPAQTDMSWVLRN